MLGQVTDLVEDIKPPLHLVDAHDQETQIR